MERKRVRKAEGKGQEREKRRGVDILHGSGEGRESSFNCKSFNL